LTFFDKERQHLNAILAVSSLTCVCGLSVRSAALLAAHRSGCPHVLSAALQPSEQARVQLAHQLAQQQLQFQLYQQYLAQLQLQHRPKMPAHTQMPSRPALDESPGNVVIYISDSSSSSSSSDEDDDDDDGGIRDASHPSVLSSSASSVEARPAVKRARRQLADAMSLDDDDGDDDNDDGAANNVCVDLDSQPSTALVIDDRGQFTWLCGDCTLANSIHVHKCDACDAPQSRVVQLAARAARAKLGRNDPPTHAQLLEARGAALQVSLARLAAQPPPDSRLLQQRQYLRHRARPRMRAAAPGTDDDDDDDDDDDNDDDDDDDDGHGDDRDDDDDSVSAATIVRKLRRRKRAAAAIVAAAADDDDESSSAHLNMVDRRRRVTVGERFQATIEPMQSAEQRDAERLALQAAGAAVALDCEPAQRPRGGLLVWRGARASGVLDETRSAVSALLRQAVQLSRPIMCAQVAVAACDAALQAAHACHYGAAETRRRLQELLVAPSRACHRVRWYYQVSPTEWQPFGMLQTRQLEEAKHGGVAQCTWRERSGGRVVLPGVDELSRPAFLPTDRVFCVNLSSMTCVAKQADGVLVSCQPRAALDASLPLPADWPWLLDVEQLLPTHALLADCTLPHCSVAQHASGSAFAVHAPLCAAHKGGYVCDAPATPMLCERLRFVKRVAVGELLERASDNVWEPIERGLFEAALVTKVRLHSHHFTTTDYDRGVEFRRLARLLQTKRTPEIVQYFVDWSQTPACAAFKATHPRFVTEAHQPIVVTTNDLQFDTLAFVDTFTDAVRSMRPRATKPVRRVARPRPKLTKEQSASAKLSSSSSSPPPSPPPSHRDIPMIELDDSSAADASDDAALQSTLWSDAEPFLVQRRYDAPAMVQCVLLCAELCGRHTADKLQLQKSILSATPVAPGRFDAMITPQPIPLPAGISARDIDRWTDGLYTANSARQLSMARVNDEQLRERLLHLLRRFKVPHIDAEPLLPVAVVAKPTAPPRVMPMASLSSGEHSAPYSSSSTTSSLGSSVIIVEENSGVSSNDEGPS
jgi:hypothetical protein